MFGIRFDFKKDETLFKKFDDAMKATNFIHYNPNWINYDPSGEDYDDRLSEAVAFLSHTKDDEKFAIEFSCEDDDYMDDQHCILVWTEFTGEENETISQYKQRLCQEVKDAYTLDIQPSDIQYFSVRSICREM